MKGRDIETGRSKGKGKIIMEILTEKPEKLEALKRAVVETAKKAYEVQRVERRALAALRKPSAGLLAFVEEQTPYFLHVGVARFNATHTSAVEEIVFKRDRMLAFDSRQSEA